MPDLLRDFKDNFGRAPREFSWWQRWTYYRIPQPDWLRENRDDDLHILFRHLPRLFSHGTVVWGHVLQANWLIWDDGKFDHPGDVVFSLTESKKVDPEALQRVTGEIVKLKGTEPDDRQLAPIAAHLTNEMTRVYGMPVPPSICGGLRCLISTTMFVRKHLPERRLCSGLLPLVVNPEPPHVAMPLPARFWPEEFVEEWAE